MLYRGRNAIDRMFCHLKDFRRITTRCGKLAAHLLSAICLAGAVSYWV
jgi:transposase